MSRGKIYAVKGEQRKTVPFYDLSSLHAGRTSLHADGWTTTVDYVALSPSEQREKDNVDRAYQLDAARSRMRLED